MTLFDGSTGTEYYSCSTYSCSSLPYYDPRALHLSPSGPSNELPRTHARFGRGLARQMARNEEKAQSMLNRFVKGKEDALRGPNQRMTKPRAQDQTNLLRQMPRAMQRRRSNGTWIERSINSSSTGNNEGRTRARTTMMMRLI